MTLPLSPLAALRHLLRPLDQMKRTLALALLVLLAALADVGLGEPLRVSGLRRAGGSPAEGDNRRGRDSGSGEAGHGGSGARPERTDQSGPDRPERPDRSGRH